jgi:hypothetical protein
MSSCPKAFCFGEKTGDIGWFGDVRLHGDGFAAGFQICRRSCPRPIYWSDN